jgi:hypothetical protein
MAITVDDVRHFMMDFPEVNVLYDNVRVFDDSDINRALDWSVENFNSEPPLHVVITSLETIPSNALILMGATKYLLQSHIIEKQRNQLDYNDGGISVSDKNQHQYMQQFLASFNAEYKDLLSRTKQYININEGFGGVDSQWRNLRSTSIFGQGQSNTSAKTP